MGHHYIPRRLLRGFSDQDAVWRFDKKSLTPSERLPIEAVANEKKMYPQDLENRLNNEFEQPFNAVLDRLDAGEGIADSDVPVIANYVLTMFRRVPRGRRTSREKLPGHVAEVSDEYKRHVRAYELEYPQEKERVRIARDTLDHVANSVLSEKNSSVWHSTITPERLPRLTQKIQQMKWMVCRAPHGEQLLIGDSPVLLPERYGLNDSRGQIALPIRHDLVLIGAHQDSDCPAIAEIPKQTVLYSNRMQVARAERWVFFKENQPWVLPFLRKQVNSEPK